MGVGCDSRRSSRTGYYSRFIITIPTSERDSPFPTLPPLTGLIIDTLHHRRRYARRRSRTRTRTTTILIPRHMPRRTTPTTKLNEQLRTLPRHFILRVDPMQLFLHLPFSFSLSPFLVCDGRVRIRPCTRVGAREVEERRRRRRRHRYCGGGRSRTGGRAVGGMREGT